MAETPSGIPDRPWFKPSEVCDIAAIQPYVLRSWEAEFPGLGVTQKGRPGRMYRKADVEQVLVIKRLMLEEGLTLAGVRRRMEGNNSAAEPEPPVDGFIGDDARARLAAVRAGLRSLLDQLSDRKPEATPGLEPTGPVVSFETIPSEAAKRGVSNESALPFEASGPGRESGDVPARVVAPPAQVSSSKGESGEGRRRRPRTGP